MWIDPSTSTYVVFLVEPRPSRRQGRRHPAAGAGWRRSPPRRRPTPRPTAPTPPRRAEAAGAAAGAAPRAAEPRRARRCSTGIDVLRAEGFARLAGASGRAAHQPHRASPATARRRSTCCTRPKNLTLVALFSPEHGIRGTLDDKVAVRHGREDRPADPLALRRDAAADRRDAGRRRHDRRRPPGRRRALLHLRRDDGRWCMEEAARRGIAGGRPRSAQPDRRLAHRGADHRRGGARLHQLPAHADPARADASASWRSCSTASARSARS